MRKMGLKVLVRIDDLTLLVRRKTGLKALVRIVMTLPYKWIKEKWGLKWT